jgi:hypothetical protein
MSPAAEEASLLLSPPLEEVIVQDDSKATPPLVVWIDRSGRKPRLSEEINACIEIIEEAKKQLPSYGFWKLQTKRYGLALQLVTIALSLGLTGASIYMVRYFLSQITQLLSQFARNIKSQNWDLADAELERRLLELEYKSGNWKVFGPADVEARLAEIWKGWSQFPHAADAETCERWIGKNGEKTSLPAIFSDYDSYVDLHNGWLLLHSHDQDPCFLKDHDFVHPIEGCNSFSGEACDLYQIVKPFHLKNEKMDDEFDIKINAAKSQIEKMQLELEQLKHQKDSIDYSWFNLSAAAVAAFTASTCLLLIILAVTWQHAKTAYQNDLKSAVNLFNAEMDPVALSRIVRLCERYGIKMEKVSIDALSDELRKEAENEDEKRECRLMFFRSKFGELPREVTHTILSMAADLTEKENKKSLKI